MKRKIYYIILSSILFAFLCSGCEEEKDNTQTQTYTCDQECKDSHVGYGLVDTFWFLWNQYIAGTPVGNKDVTGNGPLGGTIHLYGSTAQSNNGITLVNLTLDMTNCKNANTYYSLTYSGSMTCNGSYSTTYQAMGYTSALMVFAGTVGENTNTSVSETCAVTIAEEQNGLSGTICGRTFAY